MPKQVDKISCCCGKEHGRKCCKRQYQCADTALGQLDKRLVKLIELQVSKLDVTNKLAFPIYLRFETQGFRTLILNCRWLSATRFAITSIDYKSFNKSGEYLSLISLVEDESQNLKLTYCRHSRFESAETAFKYLCRKVSIDMNHHQQLNPVLLLTQLLDDAEACGLARKADKRKGIQRKEPQSNKKAA